MRGSGGVGGRCNVRTSKHVQAVQSTGGGKAVSQLSGCTDRERKWTTYSAIHLIVSVWSSTCRASVQYSPLAHVRRILYGLLGYVVRGGASRDQPCSEQRKVRCKGYRTLSPLSINLPPPYTLPDLSWLHPRIQYFLSLRGLPRTQTLLQPVSQTLSSLVRSDRSPAPLSQYR